MSFALDIILLATAALTIFLGIKRGFVKSIMGLGSFVAAAFVAYAFTPTLSEHLMKKLFLGNISSGIEKTLKSLSETSEGTFNLEKLLEDMPDAFTQILSRYNVQVEDISDKIAGASSVSDNAVKSLSEAIASPVSNVISSVLSFLILFFGSMLILGLVTYLLDLIFKLPVLSTANKVLGGVLGVAKAILLLWLLSCLSKSLIGALNSIDPDLFNESVIKNSLIVQLFTKFNPIAFLLSAIENSDLLGGA